MMLRARSAFGAVLLCVATPLAKADLIYTGSGVNNCGGCSGNKVAADADFSLSGNTLTVTLINTLAALDQTAKCAPNDALMAVSRVFRHQYPEPDT